MNMRNTVAKRTLVLACLLALLAPATLAQVMSGSAPNPAYATLQLWLRADLGVASDGAGAVVTAWTNQAVSAAAVGNATTDVIGAGNGPIFDSASTVLNSQPALAFDGASEGLDLTGNATNLLSGGLYTVFIMLYDAGPNTTWHELQMVMGNNYNTVYLYAVDPWAGNQYNDQFALQSGSPAWSTLDSSGCITNDEPYLLTAVAAGTAAGSTHLYVNGTQNDNGEAMPTFTLGSDWYIGYDPNNSSRWFSGEIAEILVYQGALAKADMANINSYLGTRYSLTLPLPVASTPTFYPPAGTYVGAQSITLTADSGATIYYTTNGTTPTAASPSGATPLTVAVPASVTNFTITAYAAETEYSNSVVTSATYNTETVTANGTQVMSGSAPNPAYTNLQLWLRADLGVASAGDGTAVTTWTNQCTSTNAVGDASDSIITTDDYGAGPTLVTASSTLNGMPALEFNGTNSGLDILAADNLLANDSYTLFLVIQANGTWPWPQYGYYQALLANNWNTIALATSGSSWLGNQYGNSFQVQSANGWGTISTAAYLGDTNTLLAATSSGSSSGQTQLYVNGMEADGGAAVAAFNLNSDWDLGWDSNYTSAQQAGGGGGRWYKGQIAEVLIYEGNLTPTEIANLNNYLGTKYAIGVPAATAPTLGFAQSEGILTFTWSGAYKLQSCTNLTSATWQDCPGGNTSGVTATNDPAVPARFFRLSQ
jgi:hypothetical protein